MDNYKGKTKLSDRLKDKVTLITGVVRGIEGCVRLFAAEHYSSKAAIQRPMWDKIVLDGGILAGSAASPGKKQFKIFSFTRTEI